MLLFVFLVCLWLLLIFSWPCRLLPYTLGAEKQMWNFWKPVVIQLKSFLRPNTYTFLVCQQSYSYCLTTISCFWLFWNNAMCHHSRYWTNKPIKSQLRNAAKLPHSESQKRKIRWFVYTYDNIALLSLMKKSGTTVSVIQQLNWM